MRWIILLIITFLIVLQYKLWFDDGSVRQVLNLKTQVAQQQQANETLKKENEQLRAEVKDLKQGSDAAEEKARRELGMVKQNEEYFQIVQEGQVQNNAPAQAQVR